MNDNELKIEKISVHELKPAAYNPRKISAESMSALVKNIKAFGLVDPIIANKDMTIIGGHQRFLAAKALGLEALPCIVLDLSKSQEQTLNIALNKISGEFDFPMLADLLQELDTGDLDMDLTGFMAEELEQIATYLPANNMVAEADAFGGLGGEKGEYEQMTFTMTNNQAGVVRSAIGKASDQGEGENSKGNALYDLCLYYLDNNPNGKN